MAFVIYGMSQYQIEKYADTKNYILDARKQFTNIADLEAAKKDVIQNARINDLPEALKRNDGKLYESRNGIAYIDISGMLVQQVDICSAFFGETVTTYRYIREASKMADNDPEISHIAYMTDSGGGYVSGCDQTAQVIADLKKPTTSIVFNTAASAAYWLTSQTNKIAAVSRTARIGSIGVAAEWINRDKQDEDAGIKREVITSTPATRKIPDLATDEGKAIVIKNLDDTHNVFVKAAIEGRPNLTAKKINSTAADVLIAGDAKTFGLIDAVIKESEIESFILNSKSPAIAGKAAHVAENKTEVKMSTTLKEFLSTNPAARAEFDNELKSKFKAGEESRQTEIDKIIPYMTKSYAHLQDSVVEVLKGEVTAEVFKMVVKINDKQVESSKSKDAKLESKDQSSANSQQISTGAASGEILQGTDYNQVISDTKKAMAQGVK